MNIANKLTVFRIVLIPVIVLVFIFPYNQIGISVPFYSIGHVTISLKNIIVLVLYTVAAVTDAIDGYLARKHNMITVFGKFLDPIADKLLVNTLFIIFAVQGTVPLVAVLLMIWRDTIVDAVRMLVSQKGEVMAAGYLGKVKTVAQMVAIAFVLLNNLPFELFGLPISSMMVWFATLMSLLSGASYVIQARSYILESM